MIISEAIALLKNAELKQLSVKDDNEAVLGFINLAILEIYKRFSLWESEAIITIASGKLLYKLDGIDSDVSINISDHSVLMIEHVFLDDPDDATAREELVINNDKDPLSIFTPQYHQIKINTPVQDKTPYIIGDTFTAVYRASPLFLTNEKQTIPIPPQFFEALFHYVGFKGHGSVKSEVKGENNVHYMRFVAACDLINTNGLVSQDDLSSNKFEQRGFV